jgi:hypothetical protein
MAGVDLATVNYRGIGPALVDLLSGRVEVIFTSIASTIDLIRSGKLRSLAVTTAKRMDGAHDLRLASGSRCIRTCCGTPAALRWSMPATRRTLCTSEKSNSVLLDGFLHQRMKRVTGRDRDWNAKPA